MGRFRPQAPWGGWVTGRWPKGRVLVSGWASRCLSGLVGDLGGRYVVSHPSGRVENARKTTAGAPRQVTEASGPTPSGHAQLAALLHARAHIPHRARTAGVARRRPWNSRVREAKQEESTSAATGTSATCAVRLACAACMRGAAACAAATRPHRRAARVCVSVDPRAPRSGGGEQGTGTHHPHHHPRACVRTYLREVAPTCDVPRLARARPSCVT